MKTIAYGGIALLLVLSLTAGCATKEPILVEVKVPVSVPCVIAVPVKPSMPVENLSKTENNIFTIVKNLLAEIELRKGYEITLEAAVASCNKKLN